MITAQHAHLWGLKAARAGLPSTANPYLNQQYRSAWEAGFHQGISGPDALDRGYTYFSAGSATPAAIRLSAS